ncbi:MAG: branched-chain amino acid ABC transporter permease [Candidatus Rokubacteria bacterium]|nr:branched-chain amino acid ABC transporter permease [Candidatus Rokubacteria bacterium]
MTLADQLAQYLASGLVVGGVYALIGLGFVIVYAVTRIINFAQGELVMLGAMSMATLVGRGVTVPGAFAVTVVAIAALAALLERVAIHPLRSASPLAVLILTIGASIAIRGAALIVWGTDPLAVPAFSPGPPLTALGAVVVRQGLWVLAVAAAVFALLWFFFNRTYVGTALRACAVNPRAARLQGVRVDRMALLAWALSGALGATAGAVIAPITYATYDMGLMLGLKGFVAAVLGGLVSPPGAILGGFLLGVLESFAAGLVSSGYKDAVAFVILIALCLVQAAGWLPWRVVEEA